MTKTQLRKVVPLLNEESFTLELRRVSEPTRGSAFAEHAGLRDSPAAD